MDLEKIDARRGKGKTENQNTHYEAILAAVYEQAKDAYLERMRNKLITVLEKLNTPLTELDKIHTWREYEKIHNAITTYASTPAFQARLAKKIAQATKNETVANLHYERGVKK